RQSVWLASLRRGGEVAAAGLAEVALVAPYRAVLDERRPGAPLAAHLDQPCPPDPAVEPSYQTVDLWVNVSDFGIMRNPMIPIKNPKHDPKRWVLGIDAHYGASNRAA